MSIADELQFVLEWEADRMGAVSAVIILVIAGTSVARSSASGLLRNSRANRVRTMNGGVTGEARGVAEA